MIEEFLYYSVTATLASFAWLILTGYRPRGESRSAGILHLATILGGSALIFLIWQRDLNLTGLFSFGYASLCVLLWKRKPDWNSRGVAFLTAFGMIQIVFLGRILWAILFGDLAPVVILGSLVLFTAEVIAVLLTFYFAFEALDVICRL